MTTSLLPLLIICATTASLLPTSSAFSAGTTTSAATLVRPRDAAPLTLAVSIPKNAVGTIAKGRGDILSLRMAEAGGCDDGNADGRGSINVPLILQSLANQALIGSTIWTGGSGYRTLLDHAHFDATSAILGVLGAVPLVAVSRKIETSENPLVSGLNLSTNAAVLNYFGPTLRPVGAAGASLLMACFTGLVEETVFRGQSMPALANQFGGGDLLVGAALSTLLFAALHTNPLGFFKSREAFVDNATLLALQLFNGGALAALYLASGNLAVAIVTHSIYDFYTFYKTHVVDVAGQMEYARAEALMPTCSTSRVERRWMEERGEEWLTAAKQSFFLMDTNRDGMLSRKELRISLYGYGVYLTKEQSARVKLAADADDSGAISFDEYLEFIGPTGSSYKAVRYTLLGPT